MIVTGEGLKGGEVDQPLKFFVKREAGEGPGPLRVRMTGASKPTITTDNTKDGVAFTVVCHDPGDYQLILKWGDDEASTNTYPIKITGKGRKVHPELCTVSGSGISTGKVGETVTFSVNIPFEAGPGTIGVSVTGPHPSRPINIVNNQDGTMKVTYHPTVPGNYTIKVTWAEQHIPGSPFTAVVTGNATICNPKQVFAEGEIIGQLMKCNQLGTITVMPKEGAGAGPLRAKLEGPNKADLKMEANPDFTIKVSFIPKDAGHYNLHLLWGEGKEKSNEINGSPFLVKVEK